MSLVDDTFGPGGYLSVLFSGYEPREQQVRLAREIDRAIRDGASLLAEAPTGVGKSVAYLVPAIRHALESGGRVAVVTANILLQEQLVRVDLPRLRSILPTPFDFALAKGRGQYLCLDRLSDTLAERVFGGESPEGLEQVVAWADETEEGDLSELPFEPRQELRRLFTVSADDCLGSACPRKEECFPNRARARLHAAQIVVANYHLFFSDMAIRSASAGDAKILPDFDVVILDEAHRAADIARDFFGFRFTAGSVRHAARLLGGARAKPGSLDIPEIDLKLKGALPDEADVFFARLAAYARSNKYRARLRENDPVPSGRLVELLAEAESVLDRSAATLPLDAAGRRRLRQAAVLCGRIGAGVAVAMRPAANAESVCFVDLDNASGRAALGSKPIDVSSVLRDRLFESASIRSTIAVSATLSTGGEDGFGFAAGELGSDKARTFEVESPFDFAKSCLFVVPAEHEICLPNESPFPREAAKVFARVAVLALGRTLGLFTTHRGMELAYERAAESASFWAHEARVPRVLRQGQMPRSELVRLFKEDVSSVLVGTSSLWEGVDVPGEALSCVCIDKLPFPTPDDPVLDSLDARDRDAFSRHMVPRALIAFRQGFGRLIRTSTDRGVVVCLDRRIFEKGYGRLFLRALPAGVRVSRDLADVRRFLDGEPVESEAVERPRPKPSAFSPEVDAGLRQRLGRRRPARSVVEEAGGMSDKDRASITETIRRATGG